MMTTLFNIVAFACVTNLWIESHPMIVVRMSILKWIKWPWFERLTNCAKCSGFWIGLISNLVVSGGFSLLVASMTSILSELINKKLNK